MEQHLDQVLLLFGSKKFDFLLRRGDFLSSRGFHTSFDRDKSLVNGERVGKMLKQPLSISAHPCSLPSLPPPPGTLPLAR